MTDSRACRIRVDGIEHEVPPGVTVAAVLMNAGLAFRVSATGEARGVLCGMGICHECRVRIDGRAHQRGCMTVVSPGMVVERDG